MFNKFLVEIDLGNAGMESGPDVARALREIADKIDGLDARGVVIDVNGNTVGNWGPE